LIADRLLDTMGTSSLKVGHLRAGGLLPDRPCRLQRMQVRLADGAATTIHVASYQSEAYTPRVVVLDAPAQLVRWCGQHQVRHAVVGGFFARPRYAPLGQLLIDGEDHSALPFDPPWGDIRACLHVVGGSARIARRDELGADPGGDLLQAGPLLVRDGSRVVAEGLDAEGFSAGAHQFDSDITQGRYPRAALALAGHRLLAVACDGRTSKDAGMTLTELADTLVEIGATEALNLDGGGSASLVHQGRLRNRPREEHGMDVLGGRPIATAIVFERR
jgi:hypothetical protein